jgi:hypothetical protein
MHDSDITPGVLCSKCGSQDTRRVNEVLLQRAELISDAEFAADRLRKGVLF